MGRSILKVLLAFAFLALLTGAVYFWKDLVALGNLVVPEMGIAIASVGVVAVLVAFYYGQSFIVEWLTPFKIEETGRLSPEEARAKAEADSAKALREGRNDIAITLLERAGLLAKALELAQQLNDTKSRARINCRMGNYQRARRLYEELGDLESAGHVSLLLEEHDASRDFYGKAAEACPAEGLSKRHEATLWDRAGQYKKAAGLYEESGDFELAAEAYKILGDNRGMVRNEDQAKSLKILERRQRGDNRMMEERREDQEKIAAARYAASLEPMGDFLLAGMNYRRAEKWVEAGKAFEKAGQWNRAVESYEKGGMKDLAEIAALRVIPPETDEEAAQREKLNQEAPPSPGAVLPHVFRAISAPAPIPVHIARQGVLGIDPAMLSEVAKRVRRGNFQEAAALAEEGNDWVMAAAYYEHAGKLMKAADIYRQIGNPVSAAWCLEKAGRVRDAVMLLLASGEDAKAVEILTAAIREGKEVGSLGLLLGEALIEWGRLEQAMELLHVRLAPDGVDVTNAETFYRYARKFEEREAWSYAADIYAELEEAGAESEDIHERLIHARMRRDEAPAGAQPEAPRERRTSWQNDKIDQTLKTVIVGEGRTRHTGSSQRTGGFRFQPPRDLQEGAEAEGGADRTIVLDQANRVSLFGFAKEGEKDGKTVRVDGADFTVTGETAKPDDPFSRAKRYEVRREVARGGMGAVFEAEDLILGRPIALKLILSEMANKTGLKQFLIEARSIAMLSHPNVVVVYDIGLMDFKHYIAMEYLKGGSLHQYIVKEKRLPLKEALRVFVEMARGLQAAHESGIVHRDIKPANVLLNEKKQVKIVDFGLAMVSDEKADGEQAAFRRSGTPGYMAPEQYRGDELLPRCDIYALGVTLFSMLVGEAPFQVAARAGLTDIRKFQESDRLTLSEHCSGIPKSLDQLYMYCIDPDPEERYQSIDAFLPTAEKMYYALEN